MKDDGKLVDGNGGVVGASLAVTDPKSQSRALSLVGSVDWIQVRYFYSLLIFLFFLIASMLYTVSPFLRPLWSLSFSHPEI